MTNNVKKYSAFSTYVAALIGIFITVSLVYIAFNISFEQAKEKSNTKEFIIKDGITQKINSIDEALYGMRSLFDASNEVETDEFRLLSSNLLERHTYIKSSMYLKLTSSKDRKLFERNTEDDGYINYSITEISNNKFITASLRDEYFPVVFIEPYTPISVKQLGYDYLSIDTFKASIYHAIDTAQAATALEAATSQNKQEFVVFIAVYAGKSTPETIKERRKTTTGVIALRINAEKLLKSHSGHEITLDHQSYNNASRNTLLHYDFRSTNRESNRTINLFKNKYRINTHSDTYFLEIKTPLFWNDLDLSLIGAATISGLIITFLIILQVKSIVNRNNELHRRNNETKKLVEARTKELAIEKERALTTLESIADAVITTDEQGNIDYLNPIAESITGWSREEAFGLPVHEVFNVQYEATQTALDYGLVYECIEKAKVVKITDNVMVINKNNSHETAVEISTAPIKGTKENINGAVVVSHDVSDARRLAREMTHLATHDDLTALPNRILLMDRLVQAISRGPWNDKYHAVLFLDLDRFKLVNDAHGHDVGDELLRHVASRLVSCLREGDTVSRLGGDEFVIILRDLSNPSDVRKIADKIINTFSTPFLLVDEEFFSTASVGISLYPKDGQSALDLMKKADIAMYRAKSLGKNNFVLYSEEMGKQDARELTLETDLRRAIERNEFELYYQPQVDAKKGIPIGAEALIRWNNPKHGLVSPLEFIPLAEQTGLIIPISQWVMKEAAKQCKYWQDLGLPPIRVSVNISAIQFERGNIFKDVKNVLKKTNLAPEYLELELTEGTLATNPQAAINTLNKLNDIGIKLSIDDFGTGYSSLSYLKQFCVSTLKIDRCFVKDVLTDSDDAAMCTAIISIAHNLNLHVIAEGVEDNDQLEFLKKHECNTIQGYYFSKPLPNDQFIKYLKNHHNQNKIIPFQQKS